MAKTKTVYICSECGAESAKWSGQCQNCGAWNTLTEEISAPVEVSKKIEQKTKAPAKSLKLSQIGKESEQRTDTGISELNRVLGGGIVKGSVVLVSGEPGIGKSTILLQMCANLDMDILYVAGEESPGQIKLRGCDNGQTFHTFRNGYRYCLFDGSCRKTGDCHRRFHSNDVPRRYAVLARFRPAGARMHKSAYAPRKGQRYSHFHSRTRQ